MGIVEDLIDARARTLALASDLDDAQWMGPPLAIVNPLRWELGHLAWFQEFWTLRHARGRRGLREDADALYDSARVAHETRWSLPLPDRAATLAYLRETHERSLEAAGDGGDPYFHVLALFHEDMHGEAFTYSRQTLAFPAPRLTRATLRPHEAGGLPGDVEVAGGRFTLGATDRAAFAFDNEKWGHEVEVGTFRIARAPVTNEEFAGFVDARGYDDRAFWSDDGWHWRAHTGARHPVYWQPSPHGFAVRRYDCVEPLAPHQPIVHVCFHEAEAYCRWAERRLPTEAEWELAASTPRKRRFPWGDDPPSAEHANLDAHHGGPVDVAAFAAGDSAYGCRQMIGNVWEWTSSDFAPFPGFIVDPYKEYSEPWFSTPHKVLRGGCWATRARLLRNTWRNFYPPDRRDVIAGFRTCAVAAPRQR